MSKKFLLPCLALCLLAIGLACDSASPVAPTGTLLSISASPNEISANGNSTIRVTALRANGTPVNPGTIVRLATTIGTIEPQVETDDQGTALAILQGDGQIGTATITARSGSAEVATVDVQVGEVASNVSLQATPSSISESGEEITLRAVVRDDQGQPLAGVNVNFTTEIGSLESEGGFRVTNSNGEVIDTLTVLESDIAALPATDNAFQVGVNAGGDTTATFEVKLESPLLEAEFRWVVVDSTQSTFTVQFTDLSRGDPTGYLWSYGDGTSERSVVNPDKIYQKGQQYTAVLQVTRGRSEDQFQATITGPA